MTALGPGRRVGVWLQGCSLRCVGCVSADTWDPLPGATTVKDVLRAIEPWLQEADGLTITGGEPLEQLVPLRELLHAIRQTWSGDVLLYTGFQGARARDALAQLDGLIDAAIVGPYDVKHTQELPLRGSDNQELVLLTPEGRRRFAGFVGPDSGPRPLDVMFDDDGTVWLAGIPRPGDMDRLRAAMGKAGHELVATDDKRRNGSSEMQR